MTLPNLLIIGAPKAGTGSLFAYLAQHPSICASTKKEIRYFSPVSPDGRSRPIEWYERFFAHRRDEPLAMEATPSYCYMGAPVIGAVRDTLDRPRSLLILREPVDRLWSAYSFQRSLGHLSPDIDTFEAYVQACEAARSQHPATIDQGHFKGLAIGMYGEFVPDWDAAFGPDLDVVFFDDLRADPRAVVRKICTWLDLDPALVDGFTLDVQNPTVHPRSVGAARRAAAARAWSKRALRGAPGIRRTLRDAYLRANAGQPQPQPGPEITQRLRDLYAGSNRALAETLARRGMSDLPDWLAGPAREHPGG